MSTLTGQTRYRLGWRGKIILQVSEWRRGFPGSGQIDTPWVASWRDATFRDLIDLAEEKFSIHKPPHREIPPPPPMPRTRPARREWGAPTAREATLYDVGIAAEDSRIEYRFLGITGMEDE